MADSGIHDIDNAFEDTEKARAEIEAKHCLDFYNLEERRRFLANVEMWRGQPALELLKAEIKKQWEARKA